MNNLIKNARLTKEQKVRLQSAIDKCLLIKCGDNTYRISSGTYKSIGDTLSIIECNMFQGKCIYDKFLMNVDKITANHIKCYTFLFDKRVTYNIELDEIFAQIP